ncbi:hypothetical protein WL1483_1736 [Aeromonas schubertii]|uniref:Uncharacterized protein n=1 Tax=Aeromonas schubertii TaxID=652 RepID=A0A0S2SHF8_9GAMM|nr:hypothetical protein WL1483_1736 [Aeromonas schubertii]
MCILGFFVEDIKNIIFLFDSGIFRDVHRHHCLNDHHFLLVGGMKPLFWRGFVAASIENAILRTLISLANRFAATQ